MSSKSMLLVGVPAEQGSRRRGCLMGPDALRTAGIMDMLERLGYEVTDSGNLVSEPFSSVAIIALRPVFFRHSPAKVNRKGENNLFSGWMPIRTFRLWKARIRETCTARP